MRPSTPEVFKTPKGFCKRCKSWPEAGPGARSRSFAMLFCPAMPRGLSSVRTSLAAAGTLLVLLVVLATLQYGWIGAVSRAESRRLLRGAQRAAEAVARDFDYEIARFLHDVVPARGAPAADIFAGEGRRRLADSSEPELVREILLARRTDSGELDLERGDPIARRFHSIPWPEELESVRARLLRTLELGEHHGPAPNRRAFHWASPWIAPEVPALIIPRATADPPADHFLIVRLDEAAVFGSLLPRLVGRHFGDSGEYDIAVVRSANPRETVYRSRPDLRLETMRDSDAQAELFGLRPTSGRRARGLGRFPAPAEELLRSERRRGERAPGSPRGAWRLLVQHRAGSLEEVVAAARRRNLAVSGAILTLLAAAVAVLVASAHRAQRLARQQMEFVAGITHELRTPLSAIRSAGQNLADGIVSDPERVRQYGDLVAREERRLSELVEQALAYSGLQARREAPPRRPVAIADVVREAITACRWLADDKGVSIGTEIPADLPMIEGDPAAMRTLLENLISNAIKYGGRGPVTVTARTDGQSVEIAVIDRGPGIASEDLPHIFEPFYRGRDVSSGPVPGSGLGLSLVRRIARSHGGSVRVESLPGKETVFRVSLPAALSARGIPEPEAAT
jgi:signal transduction histidine kinase